MPGLVAGLAEDAHGERPMVAHLAQGAEHFLTLPERIDPVGFALQQQQRDFGVGGVVPSCWDRADTSRCRRLFAYDASHAKTKHRIAVVLPVVTPGNPSHRTRGGADRREPTSDGAERCI